MSQWIEADGLDLRGRATELALLDEVVDGGPGLTTVKGPGGVGKTRLVTVWAARHGVPVVRAAAEREAPGLVRAVAHRLGVDLAGLADPDDAVRRVGRTLSGSVLVLDNLEQLDAAPVIDVWVDLGAQLVVTSRRPVGSAGERIVALAPLARPDAVALFERRAARSVPGLALDGDEVAGLVDAVDGMPFAIELASSRVGVLSPRQIRERLASLAGPASTERHRSVHACLAWSWELLDEGDRHALASLSLFRTPFTAEDAEAALGRDAFDPLMRLWTVSLLQRHATDPVRFSTTALVQQFAAGHATDDAVHRWVARIVERARDEVDAVRPELWSALHHPATTAVERGRIRHATRALIRQDPTGGLPWFHRHADDVPDLPADLDAACAVVHSEVLRGAGRSPAARTVVAEALTRLADTATDLRAPLLVQRGALHIQEGRFAEARDDLTQSLETLDGSERALALTVLGDAHRTLGELDAAEHAHRSALALYVALEDQAGQRACWTLLAHVAGRRGDRPAARAAYQRAEALCGSDHQRYGVRLSRLNYEATSGDPSAALADVDALLRAADALDARNARPWILNLAALASLPAGEPPARAIERAEAALAAQPEGASTGPALQLRLGIVGAQLVAGDLDAASDGLDAAVRAASDAGLPPPLVEGPWRVLLALLRHDAPAARAVALDGRAPPLDALAEAAREDDDEALRAHIETLDRVGRFASHRTTARIARGLLSTGSRLVVVEDGSAFELDGERVDLGRRGAAKRILVALARAGGDTLDPEALIAAGWPGERILPEAAKMRLHTAIRSLRRLGLDEVIETTDAGYRVAPAVSVSLTGGTGTASGR